MADRLNIVGERYSSRLGICGAVSSLNLDDPESVGYCLSCVATVLGDVSDTLAILSDYSTGAKLYRGMVGISEDSMEGATRLMSDVVGLCACLSNACGDAIPSKTGGVSNDGE